MFGHGQRIRLGKYEHSEAGSKVELLNVCLLRDTAESSNFLFDEHLRKVPPTPPPHPCPLTSKQGLCGAESLSLSYFLK